MYGTCRASEFILMYYLLHIHNICVLCVDYKGLKQSSSIETSVHGVSTSHEEAFNLWGEAIQHVQLHD